MKNALLGIGASLSLLACGPYELNDGQRTYLREDALAAARPVPSFAMVPFANDLLVSNGAADPALTVEQIAERMATDAEAALASCAGASALAVNDSVLLTAHCTADGVEWDLSMVADVAKTGSTVTLEVTYAGSSINGVALPSQAAMAYTGAAQTLNVQASEGGDVSSFTGSVVLNGARDEVTLDGNGQWEFLAGDTLPLSYAAVVMRRSACSPRSGSVAVGPRDVLVAENESVAVTQTVTFAAASESSGDVEIEVAGEVSSAQLPGACGP